MTKSKTRRNFLMHGFRTIIPLGLGLSILNSCKPEDTQKNLFRLFQNFTEMADLINEYRKQEGLKAIPISDKLTMVALRHVMDLNTYHPENACNNNAHSWSNHGQWDGQSGIGNWKGCCYSDGNNCMWDKGKEIANYSSNAYEIVHYNGAGTNAKEAVNSLKGSPDHNKVMLNKGAWSSFTWNAIGAIAYGNYACAWFGNTKS